MTLSRRAFLLFVLFTHGWILVQDWSFAYAVFLVFVTENFRVVELGL